MLPFLPPPSLPLTKALDPRDYAALAEELVYVGSVDGQASEHRRWEYAMALRAIAAWEALNPLDRPLAPLDLLDVGGCGSPFVRIVEAWRPGSVTQVVDPGVNYGIEESLLPPYSVVTCLSVLEHVPQVKPFLAAVARHVRPGGLLFLTVDYWACEGPDIAHFHWMRERIFNRYSVTKLTTQLRELYGLRQFGGTDWSYPGDQVYNYTFLSMAFRKEG